MDHFLCRVLSWIISMQIVVPDHFLQKVFLIFLGSCHCGSFFCKFLIICFTIVVLDHYFKGLFQFILHILILNRILLAVVTEYFFLQTFVPDLNALPNLFMIQIGIPDFHFENCPSRSSFFSQI